jgi:hypothetical protein
MFHAWVVLVTLSVVIFHGPLDAAASGTSATPPIKVVVVSGTNYEMGVQYGEQAADLIAANRDATNELLSTKVCYDYPVCQAPVPPDIVAKDIQVWTYYLEKYDPPLKEWLLGISKGCKNKGFVVSYTDLVALMVLPQEIWARPSMPYPAETGVVASLPNKGSNFLAKGRIDTRPVASCTSFAAAGSATEGHEPMVSLTTGFIPEIKQFVVLVVFPTQGERFVNLTMAGRVATNTGMNSKFAWVMTAAVNAPWLPCASSWGVTSEVYFHYLQQYAKSPADAMKYLDSTPKGGVTGNFLFADKSGVFVYEVGPCDSAIRKPGDLGERDFVVQTNNYNSSKMSPYNLGAPYFTDTFVRYDTAFKKLSLASPGTVGLDFAKALWTANDWYDASTDTWHTVPVPNDPNDYFTCHVPGNQCEGGEGQVIQFPARKTAYLQSGGPHGTSIQYYWPDNPKPTGEYTKWQLRNSIDKMANEASDDALEMIQTAWISFARKANALDPGTQQSLRSLLMEATQAWWEGTMEQKSIERRPPGRNKHQQGEQMSRWGEVYTNYATAQLYSQMVTTKLSQY